MNSPPPSPTRMTRNKKSTGLVVPHAPRWYQRLAAWLIFSLIRAVSVTLRYRWRDYSGHAEDQNRSAAIYCTWHNRLVLSMVAYYGYVRPRHSTPGIAAMVSASKDGG